MRKETRLPTLLSVFVLTFFCLLVFATVVTAAPKTYNFNFSNFFPAPHKNSVLAEQWAREIEKRSKGQVKIAYFPGGTLTPAAQTYGNVVKGIADIGESVFAYTRGRFPMMGVIDLPLGYKNGVVATALINEYYKKFKPKELDDVKVLFLHAHGPGILHTKKSVAKLEDLKGLKIRATGAVVPIVEALGAAPVGTTMPETYDALRTGVADGAMSPFESMQGWKWGEVVSSTTEDFGAAYSTGMYVVMNKTKWNALPNDLKAIFEQVSQEFILKQGKVWDEIDKAGREFAKARGNKVIPLSNEEDARWVAAVKPVIEGYTKELKRKNLPGEEAIKFCVDYLKAH